MTGFLFVPGQDLQLGLKQGLVAPEILESFFELEQNPIMAELTGRFQVSLARIITFEVCTKLFQFTFQCQLWREFHAHTF